MSGDYKMSIYYGHFWTEFIYKSYTDIGYKS